jgi:copper chaperone CopZ
MTTATYIVDGMTCGHCVSAVTGEVTKVAGVSDVAVDLETKRVTVTAEHIDDYAIRAAIEEAGYDVAGSG